MKGVLASVPAVPRPLRLLVTTALAVAGLLLSARLAGLDAPSYVVALGALIGLSYGLQGMCLTLIFRISSVINFAQPAIGLFAFSFMPLLVQVLGLPWWVALLAVLPVGFVVGATVDAVVVRRVQEAPRVVGVVATLGVAGVLASATGYVSRLGGAGLDPLGAPPGLPSFSIGPLLVSPGYAGLIISAPLMTLALALFLARSRIGLAVTASASNPDNARLSGISPGLVSALVWGVAGVISTVTTAFFLGNQAPSAAVFSPSTLLPALGAAAIGAFTSFPRAMAGGLVIGVAQQVMLWTPAAARYSDLVLLVLLLAALLLGRRQRVRGEPVGSWTTVTAWRPLPAALERLWPVRYLGLLVAGTITAVLTALAARNDVSAQAWTVTVCIMLVALSATLVTGLAGELSLGQFALALLGGGTSLVVVRETGSFAVGIVAAAVVTGVAAVALAHPALRARGLALTVLTLAFAVTVPTAFLQAPGVMGVGTASPQQPVIGTTEITIGRPYMALAMVLAGVCVLLAWNVWRGGFGQIVRAARDNEAAAQSFALRVLGSKLSLVFVSGLIAGVAGSVLVHSYTTVTATTFPVDLNIRVVLAVVMGGLGILYGGPLGVLWLFGSAVAQTATSGSATAGSGEAASLAIYSSALVLILVAPGGAAQLLQPLRDLYALAIGYLFGVRYTIAQLRGEKRLGQDQERAEQARTPASAGTLTLLPRPARRRVPPLAPADAPLLVCTDLHLRYGAVPAVDGVSLQVRHGQIVGLIGPNGAGKTSTFEIISGFTPPTSGTVELAGRDITRLRPHRRADLGLVRSFQDAALFPTMTTLEVVGLALERQRPTSTLASVLGVDLTVRTRRRAAEEVIAFFGLTPYRESRIQELSTGTRRFVELAALVSMRPRLLLLDEPSSGIAQRESEALGPLLLRLRAEFDLSLVVIEHDIPLIMSISDHVVAMAEGKHLTSGTPDEVRADQRLVDAYLGGSVAAINRSGPAPTDPTGPAERPHPTQPTAAPPGPTTAHATTPSGDDLP